MAIQFIYNQYQEGKGLAYTWWQAMHTRVDILLRGYPEKQLMLAAGDIEAELKSLEKTGSYFDKSGELYQLNQRASQSPVAVRDDLYALIDSCIHYYRQTDGYFDISIKSDGIKNGIEYVELSSEDKTVFYAKEGINLDLSGILKGYGLEKVRSILGRYDIKDALVNMGNSSVMALGNHPNGEGWKIKYNSTVGSEEVEITLKDECFTTSGNDTSVRKHIYNPVTGKLIEGKGHVSVITSTGTDGEVLSTALFAAGTDNREKILGNFKGARIKE